MIRHYFGPACRWIPRKGSSVTINHPDVSFDRSVNPYRGCEHGCVYCFARPTHTWLGLSAGLDFESRLFYKPDAVERLREELSSIQYQCQPLALGINTDAYQPVERKVGLTRRILELLAEVRLLYTLPVQLRMGLARALDGPEQTRAYLTVGRSF